MVCQHGRQQPLQADAYFDGLLAGHADGGGQSAGRGSILVDIGPNLGAINRSVLATDYVAIPLGADLFYCKV